MSHIRSHIMVCTGTGCTSSDSPKLITAFEEELKLEGMDQEVRVVKTGCFGLCAMGPIVMVFPEGACYTRVTVDDVHEIVAEHIVKGRIVTRLLHMEGEAGQSVTSLSDTQFYKHQLRIALRNCGVINPESIDEYIGMDGYTALERILTLVRRQRENQVEIKEVEDGWKVTLTITDIGSDLLSLTIFMPTRKECEAIRRRFLNDPMLTYKGVFALLTGDTQTVGELVESQQDLFND